MAWKTITLSGWYISFERDSQWYIKHKEVSGFCSIDKVEVEGESTTYNDSDFYAIDMGKIISIYPKKATNGLKRCKNRECYSFKINVSQFDIQKLQLHYADVVIKIGDDEIETNNRIIHHITYNGRKCHIKWVSSEDKKYQTVIWDKSPFIYDSLAFNDNIATVELNGKYGFINTKGTVLIPFEYDNALKFKNGLAPIYTKSEGWGFIDKIGKEVIRCKYNNVHHFSEGLALVQEDSRYFGFIDIQGKMVIPSVYYLAWDGVGLYDIYNFNEGHAVVCMPKENTHQLGYVNKNGELITPSMKCSCVRPFSEGLGAVCSKNGWGFVDKTGYEIIPCGYSNVRDFSEEVAAVKKDDYWGFIDKSNAQIIPCIYDNVYSFSEGLAAVKVNGKWGYVDKSGNCVIACEFSEAYNFYNGFASVKKNKKEGVIDKNGNLVIPCIYDDIYNFQKNGLACVSLHGKMGCIDKTGKVIIPFEYDSISNCDTVLIAELGEKMGFIDLEGNPIEDFSVYKTLAKKYDQVWIDNGNLRTYTFVYNGKYGLADAYGNVLVSPHYDWMGNGFADDLLVVGIDNKGIGFINKQGKEIIAPIYEEASDFYEGFAKVRLNGKWGKIDKQGDVVEPFIHDSIEIGADKIWLAKKR